MMSSSILGELEEVPEQCQAPGQRLGYVFTMYFMQLFYKLIFP